MPRFTSRDPTELQIFDEHLLEIECEVCECCTIAWILAKHIFELKLSDILSFIKFKKFRMIQKSQSYENKVSCMPGASMFNFWSMDPNKETTFC